MFLGCSSMPSVLIRNFFHAMRRVLSALGSVETMIPLHSVVASARLRSSIAADSSCWSWLSQGNYFLSFFVYYPLNLLSFCFLFGGLFLFSAVHLESLRLIRLNLQIYCLVS